MTGFLDISWGFVALLTWGVADYLARASSLRIGSLSTALLVQGLGVGVPAAYLGLLLAFSGAAGDVDWPRLAYLAPLTAVFLGLGYAVYYTGLERGSVSLVSAVTSAWLLVSILIATLAFNEEITAVQGLFIAVILGGITMLSLRRGPGDGGATGIGYGVASMLLLGTAFAMWKPLTEAAGPLVAVLSVRVLSSLAVWAYLRARAVRVRWPATGPALRLLVGAAVLDAAGYVAYNIGLDRAPLTIIAPLGAAHPLATIALALVFLRERPSRLQSGGIAITVVVVVALSAAAGG